MKKFKPLTPEDKNKNPNEVFKFYVKRFQEQIEEMPDGMPVLK